MPGGSFFSTLIRVETPRDSEPSSELVPRAGIAAAFSRASAARSRTSCLSIWSTSPASVSCSSCSASSSVTPASPDFVRSASILSVFSLREATQSAIMSAKDFFIGLSRRVETTREEAEAPAGLGVTGSPDAARPTSRDLRLWIVADAFAGIVTALSSYHAHSG
jgi:hypothetical protein